MNKHEFETLTGLQVGADEYEAIEKVYTATEDDKHKFCQMWKDATPDSRGYMMSMAIEHEKVIEKHKAEEEKTRKFIGELSKEKNKVINGLLNAMLDSVNKMSDPELREVCIKHMGKAEYLRRMLDRGYNFWEDDKVMLSNILQEYID